MHQHADDTSIHAQSPSDAQTITMVYLHVQQQDRSYSAVVPRDSAWTASATLRVQMWAQQSNFVAQDASVKYLGIPLSRQPEAAATALYAAIFRRVELKIARWSGFGLSFAEKSVCRQAAARLHGDLSCHLHSSSAQSAGEVPVHTTVHIRRREQASS